MNKSWRICIPGSTRYHYLDQRKIWSEIFPTEVNTHADFSLMSRLNAGAPGVFHLSTQLPSTHLKLITSHTHVYYAFLNSKNTINVEIMHLIRLKQPNINTTSAVTRVDLKHHSLLSMKPWLPSENRGISKRGRWSQTGFLAALNLALTSSLCTWCILTVMPPLSSQLFSPTYCPALAFGAISGRLPQCR